MVDPSSIQISKSLSDHREGFWSHLLTQGYTPLSSANLLRLMAHLSRWLDENDVKPNEFSSEQAEKFLCHRQCEGYTGHRTEYGLRPVVNYLQSVGVFPYERSPLTPETELDNLLCQYGEYLVRERALVTQNVKRYKIIAHHFLSNRFDPDLLGLEVLTAADITSYILSESRSSSISTTKNTVTALRSLIRYLHIRGDLPTDLSVAAFSIAGSRLAGLPKGLTPDEVKRLLRSCDRRKHVGRRDYAVILLMVRLGLRSFEVANLVLDDIDWRQGEMTIRGKGGREDRLPLMQEVGEAVASYLRKSRPRTEFRSVFLTVRAPRRPLTPGAVKGIVREAGKRIGLKIGAHRLRHTAATRMLQNGASLSEIAQVLRHQSPNTTAIYAKVDGKTLRTVCRPWPEVTL